MPSEIGDHSSGRSKRHQVKSVSLDPESNRGPTDTRLQLQSAALPTELSRGSISSMGLEPTTLGLLDPRSNQLSYEDQ